MLSLISILFWQLSLAKKDNLIAVFLMKQPWPVFFNKIAGNQLTGIFMKTKIILIALFRMIAVMLFTLVITFIMGKLSPPPKGTAFDALDYVLLPVYFGLAAGIVNFVSTLINQHTGRKVFYMSLFICTVFVVLLYLRIL